ncbi:Rrf2 family transcriptional regulator [Alphaproteobacteria bacterium]|jgi:Rrf2 family protein|nr:Rrf2 family transcriptional regulator [Alphaproteobacteria bacterium]
MRLTRKLMFAIEAVLDIAYNASDRPVQSSEIAKRQGIPRRYLEHVLQCLVRAEILRGVRGPRGGYRLARERRRILLGEIARLISELDGSISLFEKPAGSELGQSVLVPVWQNLHEQALLRLDSISIEDLCVQAREAGAKSAADIPMNFGI